MSDQQSFRLLDLPRELRDKIYEHELPAEHVHHIDHGFHCGDARYYVGRTPATFSVGASKNINLLLTNKQVGKEYGEAFHRATKDGNHVTLRVKMPDISDWLKRDDLILGMEHMCQLHHVKTPKLLTAILDIEVYHPELVTSIAARNPFITRAIHDFMATFIPDLYACDHMRITFNFPNIPSCHEVHRREVRSSLWDANHMKTVLARWFSADDALDAHPPTSFIVELTVGGKVYESLFRCVGYEGLSAIDDDGDISMVTVGVPLFELEEREYSIT